MMARTSETIPRQGLGERLEEARKSVRLTIEQAAEALRIPANVLSRIERGEYSELPPDAFLRGIIRKYAVFLGLEPNACVEQYLCESGRTRARTSGPTDLLPANRFSGQRRYWSFGVKQVAVLAGIMVVYYLLWQVSGFVRPPSIDLDAPLRDTVVTRQSAFVVSGTLKGAERVMVNGERIGADTKGRFQYPIELREGENIIELRAEDARGKVTTLIRRIIYQPEH